MSDENSLWIHRPSRGAVLMILGVLAGFAGVVVLAGWLDGWVRAVALVGEALAGLVVVPRLLWMTVVAYPDHLIVRNSLRTHRIRRSRVDGVEIGPSPGAEQGTWVWLRLCNGERVPLDAMWTYASGSKGTRVCEDRAAKLRAWAVDPVDP